MVLLINASNLPGDLAIVQSSRGCCAGIACFAGEERGDRQPVSAMRSQEKGARPRMALPWARIHRRLAPSTCTKWHSNRKSRSPLF